MPPGSHLLSGMRSAVTGHEAVASGIRVTATDLDNPQDTGSVEVMDNYVLICAGTCEQTYAQVSYAKDGTQTHVITIKGIRK
jgi:hypothetical protein